MKFKQVYERCKEKGITITKQGLYLAGLQNGFIIKGKSHRNEFVKEEFEKWVEKKLEPVPEGFISFFECSKKLNKPLPTIYFLVKSGNLEVKKIGTRGVRYVRLEDLEKYIEIREHGSEEEYGN
jgi:hypothetical protein